MKTLAIGCGLALAVLALSGCATKQIPLAAGAGGDAVAGVEADGTISLTLRTADGGGGMDKSAVVKFKPSDPAYDMIMDQAEKAWGKGKKKPTLVWEIGTPVFTPAPAKTEASQTAP